MPFLKIVELICGLILISGRFVTLIAVVIVPITINILLVHIFLAPEGLPVAVFMFLGNIFLLYYYRNNYQSLLVAK